MAEITSYLKNVANLTNQVKKLVEQRPDRRKQCANKSRSLGLQYSPGDHVWIEFHPVKWMVRKELPN